MEEKSIIVDYLVGVMLTGFGILIASVMAKLFVSSEIDWKLSLYEKEGKTLENRDRSVVNFKYFQIISTLKESHFRAELFARLVPLAFVGLLTIWSAVMLSMKTSANLAITVGGVFLIALIAMRLLVQIIKATQIKGRNEK